MKVLHVITALDARTGGPTSAMLALAQAQQRVGASASIIATYITPQPEPVAALERLGIRVDQIGPARGTLRRHPELSIRLHRLVSMNDVVHIHAVWEEIQHQAARACQDVGVPYVITPHGMLDAWSLGHGRLKKQLYLMLRLRRHLDRATLIHFTSQAERDSTQAALRLSSPTADMPLGIDLSEFDPLPLRGRLRSRFPQIAERAMVVYLGRLHAGKGLELLVPALAQCRVEAAVLLVVGPDNAGYRPQVEAMARKHGVAERVIFTGMLRGAERLEALVDADLLALPSFHENFGMAVVEALACGTPVLISDQVNIHREIAEAGVGAVVPTQVEPLAAALRTWLTDEGLRRAAAERARPFARQMYDLERIARRWIDQYRQIIESHRAGVPAPAAARTG